MNKKILQGLIFFDILPGLERRQQLTLKPPAFMPIVLRFDHDLIETHDVTAQPLEEQPGASFLQPGKEGHCFAAPDLRTSIA